MYQEIQFGRRQLHVGTERAVAEELVAGELDRADLGDVAFLDRDRDVDAIALDRRDRGLDLHAIEAARQILATQFLLGALEQRSVVDAAVGQSDVAQRLEDLVFLELLDAGELDRRDRRTLVDDDDQYVAVDFESDVLEKAARVERADRLRAALGIEAVADADRQVGEDGAGLGALDAFDADVADDEFLRACVQMQWAASTAAATRRNVRRTLRLDDTRRSNSVFHMLRSGEQPHEIVI